MNSLTLIALGICLFIATNVPEVVRSGQPAQQHVLVAVGAIGSAEYGSMFRTWAERWETAAKVAEAGFSVIGLNETPSDKDAVTQAIERWAGHDSREPLWIVLIGHGTFDGRTARFNLRGPDISATEISELLKNSNRPVALINCTSSSAPFINEISGPDRVILTATKSGSQIHLARFGDAMSSAIAGTEADLNQDGQVSLLEAWAFAARRTEEFYESNGRLATEHTLLDDNGDGLGSRRELFAGVQLRVADENAGADGNLARHWHLIRNDEERRLSAEHRRRRNELEHRLEAIKLHRDDHTESDYLKQLESVLIPLARLYQEIDSTEAGPELEKQAIEPVISD